MHHDAEFSVAKPVRVMVILLDGIPVFLKRPGWDGGKVLQCGSNQFRRIVFPKVRTAGGIRRIARGDGTGFFH